MLKRILCGTVALLVCGSMAFAGEGLGLKVEPKLEIGLWESAESEIDGEDIAEYNGISLCPSVKISKQFLERWHASFEFGGIFGFDDDDGEVLEEDGETSFDSFHLGGLVGYTFNVNDKFTLTPVGGLSWRTYEIEGDMDDYDADAETESDYLTLDLGATMAYKVNDKFTVNGELMFGIPLAGSSEAEVGVGGSEMDDDADLDGGFLFAIGGNVEYKLNEMVSLTGGLAYEMATVDWDWDDSEDGEDELSRIALQLAAVFRF